MSVEVDKTQWSLPGLADAARDELQMQLEVYKETILLRSFEDDSTWVRTVSADGIANVFTQHLGSSSGLLPREALWWNQGETGQVAALWRPPQVWSAALQREAFKPPARLRLPMPGLVFVCSPGRAPWVYAATERPTDAEQHLFRAPAFNVFSDGRACPGSHRFPEEVGLIPESFFQSLLLADRRFPQPLEETPRQPAITLGGARWRNCIPDGGPGAPMYGGPRDGGLRRETGLPLAPEQGRWATWSTTPGGLAGVQGIGYDYVLGSGGVYVQSRSAHLTARVLVAPGPVRGLAPVAEKLQLTHGPIPARLFELGLRWFQDAPETEAVLRRPLGWARLPAGRAPAGRDRNETRVSAPRRGGRRVPLPRRLPRLLLGHRRPGRAGLPHLRGRGTPRRPTTGTAAPGRGLRPLRPAGLVPGVRRPGPGRPAHGRRAGVGREPTIKRQGGN